jgi:hypothetical protein
MFFIEVLFKQILRRCAGIKCYDSVLHTSPPSPSTSTPLSAPNRYFSSKRNR